MPATYEPIATTTLGSATATITFSSIPATYTDLVLIWVGAQTGAGNTYIGVRYNSDTANNYSYTALNGDGTTVASQRSSNNNQIFLTGGSPVTTTQNMMTMQVFNYANTSVNKTLLSRSDNGDARTEATVGLWRSTSAINSISLLIGSNNFATNTTATLYGIKNA